MGSFNDAFRNLLVVACTAVARRPLEDDAPAFPRASGRPRRG